LTILRKAGAIYFGGRLMIIETSDAKKLINRYFSNIYNYGKVKKRIRR